MNKTQLMEQIAELNRQMNELTAANRVPSLNIKNRSFPLPTWISAIVLLGVGVMGPGLPFVGPTMKEFSFAAPVLMGLGALVTLFALYRTLMWLIKGNQKVDRGYSKKMDQIQELTAQRNALQKQLDNPPKPPFFLKKQSPRVATGAIKAGTVCGPHSNTNSPVTKAPLQKLVGAKVKKSPLVRKHKGIIHATC